MRRVESARQRRLASLQRRLIRRWERYMRNHPEERS